MNDTAYRFGLEDALEQANQQGSAFFTFFSEAWHSYNDGYAAGCALLHQLTGIVQPACVF